MNRVTCEKGKGKWKRWGKRRKNQKDEEDKVSKRFWPYFRQSNQSVEETSNRSEASLSLLDNHESLVRTEEGQNVDTITEDNVLPPCLEKLEDSEIPNITMPDVIKQHDLGVIWGSFNDRGKPVIPESIRTEKIWRDRFFQSKTAR